MKYSLCGVPFHLVCSPPSETAGLQRLLESLFSLEEHAQVRPPGTAEGVVPRFSGAAPGGPGAFEEYAPVMAAESPPDGPGAFVPVDEPAAADSIEISIRIVPSAEPPPNEASGELVFESPGLSAIRTESGYCLTSRGSSLTLDLRFGTAEGSLTCAFMQAPPEDQRGLFLFAFLLLLSERGLYGLHAAGVSWNGHGFLLAGGSGSGKTTLTCALVRSGWQYLSDDAVLLRRGQSGVEALAFGRLFHCPSALFRFFPELARGVEPPARGKRLVDGNPVYPGQARRGFRPQAILFPEIGSGPVSRLIPLGRTATLLRLLGAQGPPDAVPNNRETHPSSHCRDRELRRGLIQALPDHSAVPVVGAATTCAGSLGAQGPPDAAPNSRGTHPSSRDSAAITCASSSKEGAGLLRKRDYMAAQMAILGDLARSAHGFRLLQGTDVHTNPSRVSALLRRIAGRGSISRLQGDRTDARYFAA